MKKVLVFGSSFSTLIIFFLIFSKDIFACSDKQIESAIGCITFFPPSAFAVYLLRFAIGIGGGIAFLLMIVGVFQIITSGGNPDKLKAGQELITSAIMGLLMIIFSVFLLRLIGVQILDLSGFSQ